MKNNDEQNREYISWEITTIQARLAKRRESIKSLSRYQKEDKQKLKELTDSVKH